MKEKSKLNASREQRYRNINHPNKFSEPEFNELKLPNKIMNILHKEFFIYPIIVILF